MVDDKVYALAMEDAKKKGIPIQDWIAFVLREYLTREHSRHEVSLSDEDSSDIRVNKIPQSRAPVIPGPHGQPD
ncbi:MAG: hypothetical protein LUQ25_08365, partial [Methanoregulaceae archaeon]|nr:hypothetical protein [Methanoregulaceae archaeon]